jgi:hypothetical protein
MLSALRERQMASQAGSGPPAPQTYQTTYYIIAHRALQGPWRCQPPCLHRTVHCPARAMHPNCLSAQLAVASTYPAALPGRLSMPSPTRCGTLDQPSARSRHESSHDAQVTSRWTLRTAARLVAQTGVRVCLFSRTKPSFLALSFLAPLLHLSLRSLHLTDLDASTSCS